MTRVREVIEQAVSTVDENLDDPNTSRRNDKNKSWIFDHFPKYQGNQKPRIGFYKGGIGRPQVGLGDVTTYKMADMNCGVFVNRKDYYDFDNDGVNEPAEDLIDYITEKVVTIIEVNQSDFTSLGADVNYVKPLDSNNPVRPENQNWIFQQTPFEVRID